MPPFRHYRHDQAGDMVRQLIPYIPAPHRPDGVHDRLQASLVMSNNYGRSSGEIDAAFAEAAETGQARLLGRDFLVQTGPGEFEFRSIPAPEPSRKKSS